MCFKAEDWTWDPDAKTLYDDVLGEWSSERELVRNKVKVIERERLQVYNHAHK